MTRMPSKAGYSRKSRPPNKLAMAFRFVSLPPLLWLTAASRAAAKVPPIAASVEHNANTDR